MGEDCFSYNSDYIVAYENNELQGKYGVIDSSGNVIVPINIELGESWYDEYEFRGTYFNSYYVIGSNYLKNNERMVVMYLPKDVENEIGNYKYIIVDNSNKYGLVDSYEFS